jgi:hypothetical protein
MTAKDAEDAAKSILEKRAKDANFTVLVDNPNDCKATINAFKKLGCRVKVEQDGARLTITRQA